MDRRMGILACGGTPTDYGRILPRRPLRWTGLVLAALAAGPLSAQTVVPSPARARTDSTRAAADSFRPAAADTTRATPYDSVRRDSIGRPVGDSARHPAGQASQAAPAAPPPSPAAMDSVLAAACAGGGLAANLLVVLFTPTTADSDRVALAKAVGGRLAGPADAVRAGGYYLLIPNADLDPTVADRVIRYPTVQEVGPVSCPSP